MEDLISYLHMRGIPEEIVHQIRNQKVQCFISIVSDVTESHYTHVVPPKCGAVGE